MLGRPLMIEPAVHEGVGRVVVDLLGLHRADDADVVGDPGDVREQVGDFLARFAVLLELARRPAGLQRVFCSCASCWPLVNDSGNGLPCSSFSFGL